ncbi:MAG: tetratricopeptide repeat protein [Myxococcales bacterium]|nr:tetratricopeptide repeat protein [Myxococcales bacterium]
MARARIRWAEHQPEAALEDLDRALALTPDPTATLLRAEWQRAQGRLPEAAAGLADVLTRAQGALPVRRALVEAYLDLKQPELARALLDAAPPEDPTWKALRARAAAR